jgi:putative transposase
MRVSSDLLTRGPLSRQFRIDEALAGSRRWRRLTRPPRLEFPDAVYHVTCRGNERRPVFRDDVDREQYLDRLRHYRTRLRFRLLAYCLMSNHVHLVLRSGDVPLSRIMGPLLSSYAQWFNRRHERTGHLFQDRYKAFLVQEGRYFVSLVRYVHRNPVQAKLVTDARDYPWSSDRFFRAGKGPSWMDLDEALSNLARDRRAATRRYSELVDGPERQAGYEEIRTVDRVIKGDERFAFERFESARQLDPPLRGLTEDHVIDVVARLTGFTRKEIAGPRKGGSVARARALAVYVARRMGRISTRRMARRLQRDDSSFVRPVAGLEERLATDPGLRRQIDRIVQEIRWTTDR